MKKTGLLLCLALAIAAPAQQINPIAMTGTQANWHEPEGTSPTSTNVIIERVQTPTYADLYCGGFISKSLIPNANFVSGGLETPTTTKNANGAIVYLAGSGYQTGQKYQIVRELRDPNRYELFPGQHSVLKATGQPYSEVGWVQVIDTRSRMAIAQVQFSCDPVNPGDLAVPFVEKPAIAFHPPQHFDRFLPSSAKLSGRIVMARDFDSELGNGMKVYMNVGSNQGVKVGDYFRAVRRYEEDLDNPVDSLSFKASTSEDTQKREPSIEQHMFTKAGGPVIHVRDFPRRAVGEIVVIGITPTTATGMIVFTMEDVHVGDGVELDEQ
jgi:hypothetical protein